MEAQCSNNSASAPEEGDSRTQQQREKKPELGPKSILNAAYRGRAELREMTAEEKNEYETMYKESEGYDVGPYRPEINMHRKVATVWDQSECARKAVYDDRAKLALEAYNSLNATDYTFVSLGGANKCAIKKTCFYFLTFYTRDSYDSAYVKFKAHVRGGIKGKDDVIVFCGPDRDEEGKVANCISNTYEEVTEANVGSLKVL